MNQADFNQGLFAFLNASPTPYHAVATMIAELQAAKFSPLNERAVWDCEPGKGYYLTRQDSSIIAFRLGSAATKQPGCRIVGAHTDSPCLKIKPNADIHQHNYHQLGVEVYGGALLNPWFDRDLSIAGRVDFETTQGTLEHCLIDFEKAIVIIPSLAIHLNRQVNEGQAINPQTDIVPILTLQQKPKQKWLDILSAQLKKQHARTAVKKILHFDLNCYDTQKATLMGLNEDFIAGQRLDNLLSCYIGLQSLIQTKSKYSSFLVCYDHEEVGSQSAIGANGTFLASILARLFPDQEKRAQLINQSILVSLDNAHGVHPNFPDRHDPQHAPILNQGVVIKTNHNQRYATNSCSGALFKQCAQKAKVPTQEFVIRSDMSCGSTIGPYTASQTGITTVDAGVPTFAMHSIRELAGSVDAFNCFRLLQVFYGK